MYVCVAGAMDGRASKGFRYPVKWFRAAAFQALSKSSSGTEGERWAYCCPREAAGGTGQLHLQSSKPPGLHQYIKKRLFKSIKLKM